MDFLILAIFLFFPIFVSVVLPIAFFMGIFFRFLPILVLLRLFSVFGFVTVGVFTISRFLVSVRWPFVTVRRCFVSIRVLMTVSVLLRILVSVSVIQRADSGWPSPSVFFDVIVFGRDGIVTVLDIQGLCFVVFLSISVFTDFFDGIINVAGVVLLSVGFFVSVRITITMLLVSAIHRLLVTVGILPIGWLVSVVVVPTISWRLVTIGFLAIGWLLITVGIMTICWLGSVVAVSAIHRLLVVTVTTIGFWRLISVWFWRLISVFRLVIVLRLVSIRFFPILIGFVFALFNWRIRRWCFLPTFVSLLAKSNDNHSE